MYDKRYNVSIDSGYSTLLTILLYKEDMDGDG